MNSSRNNNLDLLRIIACIMVIVQHVLAIYIYRLRDNAIGWEFIANIFMSCFVYAVPLFVMLSGKLLLSNIRNKNFFLFYKKTLKRIVVPTLIWSAVYVGYRIFKLYLVSRSGENVDYLIPLRDWVRGEPFNHLWYMYMIIGLYMVTPIIIRVKEKVGEKSFLRLTVLFVLISFLLNFYPNLYWPFWWVKYIGYYCIGYFIGQLKLRFLKPYIFLLITLAMSFLILIFKENNFWQEVNIFSNTMPFTIIGSISIFIFFSSIREVKINLSSLSLLTFNIYIVHQGVIDILGILINKVYPYKMNPLVYIPIMTIIVFLLSLLISTIIDFIPKSINKINNKLNFNNFRRLIT